MNSTKIKISSNRSFGIVFGILFLLISLYPLLKDEDLRTWSIIVSVIFLLLGLFNSSILSPLNKVWFKFGILLGSFVSPIVMGIVFFLVVTPISLLMRLFGKDVLQLKKNNSKSYWIEKSGPKSRMKDQF